MGHQVVWAACAVTDPSTGQEEVFRKGDLLPDYVDEFTLFVLTSTGGARFVEAPDPVLSAAQQTPDPVRLQEHPALASDAALAERGTLAGDAAARIAEGRDTGTGRKGDGDRTAVRPAANAAKAEWVEYAVRNGADRAKAEAATKDDLQSTKDYTSSRWQAD